MIQFWGMGCPVPMHLDPFAWQAEFACLGHDPWTTRWYQDIRVVVGYHHMNFIFHAYITGAYITGILVDRASRWHWHQGIPGMHVLSGVKQQF